MICWLDANRKFITYNPISSLASCNVQTKEIIRKK